jgi:oxygen-independent coproporphyrinogen-3 oxidase
MGITAISQLGKISSQNYKTEREYYKAIDEEIFPVAKGYHLTEDDIIRGFVIMRLMCDFELNFKNVEKKFGIDFRKYFAWGLNNLKEMEEDNLLEIKNDHLKVFEMGKLLIRNIAMNFDGYIERKEDTTKYSRTV